MLKKNKEYQIHIVDKTTTFETYKIKVFLAEDATIDELKEDAFKQFNLDIKNENKYKFNVIEL